MKEVDLTQSFLNKDTIAALATPPGYGGIGVIRVSGIRVGDVMQHLLHKTLQPRYAEYGPFYSTQNQVLDEGIALFFKNPHSFTGEDILEIQAHGGPVVLDHILKEIYALDIRPAEAGEFTARAYFNNKIDLSQAEAIADLIAASSVEMAQAAVRSLQGEFSKKIQDFLKRLIKLRVYVEAAIDFPEEEIDFLADDTVYLQLMALSSELKSLLASARQGSLLREGMKIVIAGFPNAGKSTLLNALSGYESAIVTAVPGTTRDINRETIHIDGIPFHLFDTAGLRHSEDLIEQEGIKRAKQQMRLADRILLLMDIEDPTQQNYKNVLTACFDDFKNLTEIAEIPITLIYNKIDLIEKLPHLTTLEHFPVLYVSAEKQQGIDLLRSHLKESAGVRDVASGIFTARRRHIVALEEALHFIEIAQQQLTTSRAGELVAEDLRQAQLALNRITGEFTSDDLLGEIFSSFCVGK